MKALITGATGFIGTYLVKRLHGLGFDCRCLVRDLDKAKSIFYGFDNIEFIVGDIVDPESLNGITDGIDYVFHLASIKGHDLPSKESLERFRRVNVEGTRNILKQCLNNIDDIKKIFHFSSTATYGILRNHLLSEETSCNPFTCYQVSKYEADLLVFSYMNNGLPLVILRPCMIYGPGFTGDFLTMARVAKSRFYPKFGNGNNFFPAMYIDDLIDLVILAIDKASLKELYLVGPDKSNTQNEVANIMQTFFKKKLIRIYLPIFLARLLAFIEEKTFLSVGKNPIVTYRNISSITFDRFINFDKSNHIFKFHPKVSLKEGLLKTLSWYKKEGLI
ncbi:MAG: NAD(P)-dependent oxidoreductase [Candidatus Gygaella obscura]|nr:NAD(P)-dependent oxidoreductase [Candidatus Gygaella obscura]